MRKTLLVVSATVAATFLGGIAQANDYTPRDIPDPATFVTPEQNAQGEWVIPFCTGGDGGIWIKAGRVLATFDEDYGLKIVPKTDCVGSRGAAINGAKGQVYGGLVQPDDFDSAVRDRVDYTNYMVPGAAFNFEVLQAFVDVKRTDNDHSSIWQLSEDEFFWGVSGELSGTVSTLYRLGQERSAFNDPTPDFGVNAGNVVNKLTARVNSLDAYMRFGGLGGDIVKTMNASNKVKLVPCGHRKCDDPTFSNSSEPIYVSVTILSCQPGYENLIPKGESVGTIGAYAMSYYDSRLDGVDAGDGLTVGGQLNKLLDEVGPMFQGFGQPVTSCE